MADQVTDQATKHPRLEPFDEDAFIHAQLKKHSPTFARLQLIRQQGWESPAADEHFERQRQNADHPDSRTATHFYYMMQDIATEIHDATGVLRVSKDDGKPVEILDWCMAPGGFLNTLLILNPASRVTAFTLPVECGGHEVKLPMTNRVFTTYLDLNYLSGEMGYPNYRCNHPEAMEFYKFDVVGDIKHDIVICDGQVLRQHIRHPHRELHEATRLIMVQACLGLKHIKTGGTMIILLHKLGSWETACLLHRFTLFSKIQLFKPTRHHASRSSFYLIATDVQPKHPEAVWAVQQWRFVWASATFGPDDALQKILVGSKPDPVELWIKFGAQLMRMGEPVWELQADAIERAKWFCRAAV